LSLQDSVMKHQSFVVKIQDSTTGLQSFMKRILRSRVRPQSPSMTSIAPHQPPWSLTEPKWLLFQPPWF
jgi:hypothetical protein